MIGFLEVVLRYLALWVAPPLLLLVLAVGPSRVRRWDDLESELGRLSL